MRSIVDFYRRNPLVLALVVVLGGVISAAVAAAGGNGIIAPVVLVALIGVLVGLGIAAYRGGSDR